VVRWLGPTALDLDPVAPAALRAISPQRRPERADHDESQDGRDGDCEQEEYLYTHDGALCSPGYLPPGLLKPCPAGIGAMKQVRIGCSGWNYRDWRGPVYPEGLPQRLWLQRYAELFDTVEVNNTFYRLPRRDAVAAWAEQTPAGFVFSVKASRYLTHVKRLARIETGARRFFEHIEPLVEAGKLGPVLWQLPANFGRDDERLGQALAVLPAGRHCFEFRHESWFREDVYKRLRDHGVALVIGDDPERPFQSRELTADWTFIRFHRGSRGRGGNYSVSELETWKRRIAAWRSRAEVFAYFNNDWRAYAVRNGRWLAARLR
jgi:uncharacterized protein YecE (DUF72 family)